MNLDYVHGYSADESTRLTDQATTLTELLHADTRYPPGSLVLEAGCGVGAQTVILARNSPQAAFTSIDISEESLAAAQRRVQEVGFTNVGLQRADIFDLPFLSAHFDPDSHHARRAIRCLVDLQQQAGGDSLIGRRLYPLLTRAGYRDVKVSPRMVYADASRRALVDGFTRKTFTAMVEGVGEQAVGQGLMDAASWAAGIRDLYRTAEV